MIIDNVCEKNKWIGHHVNIFSYKRDYLGEKSHFLEVHDLDTEKLYVYSISSGCYLDMGEFINIQNRKVISSTVSSVKSESTDLASIKFSFDFGDEVVSFSLVGKEKDGILSYSQLTVTQLNSKKVA